MSKDIEFAPKTVSAEAGASAIRDHKASGKTFVLRDDVVVNVRFMPNGLVNTIPNLPEAMRPQVWFDHLCRSAPLTYKPLSGGRGTFVIGRDEFATIRSAVA